LLDPVEAEKASNTPAKNRNTDFGFDLFE